ncbi:Predicted dehydrogenase [Amycolatopsis australiensis]|uniref:Predicted dehydrogenase n=1 Tax=Amycolatopsis australiensis TaxID=546364 RepID=A0A1K1RTM1_9PSEU|nr:Predicted dehydrogenase [Amycolatopsis australiensis]
MSRVLRLGALGCSSIAARRTLPALSGVDGLALAAVAARSPEKAAEFGRRFGATAMTYDELLASPAVDAVYVSLPTALHHEWTRKALLAGKHVLCEKPLTLNHEQAVDLAELAAKQDLVLRENFTFVHHPQHARVRELLDGGRLGELRTFSAAFGIPPLPAEDIRHQPALGGGALLDVGVYPLRAALFLLGPQLRVTGATLRFDGRGVDVAGHALITSASGVTASLEFGFQHSYRSRYELWGSAAALSLDRAFTPPPGRQPVLRIEEQDHVEELWLPPAHQFQLSLRSFTAAALAGRDESEAAWLASSVDTARLAGEVLAAAGERAVTR